MIPISTISAWVFRKQTNETLGVVLRRNKNYNSLGLLTHFIHPQEQSESERIRSNQVIPRDTWRLPSYFPWELLFFTSRNHKVIDSKHLDMFSFSKSVVISLKRKLRWFDYMHYFTVFDNLNRRNRQNERVNRYKNKCALHK